MPTSKKASEAVKPGPPPIKSEPQATEIEGAKKGQEVDKIEPALSKAENSKPKAETQPDQPVGNARPIVIPLPPDNLQEPPAQAATNDREKKAHDPEPSTQPPGSPKYPPSTTAYYKFDEGNGTNAVNAVNGSVDGSHNATYTNERPTDKMPLTGESNGFGLIFSGKETVTFKTPFIFHEARDATLEFWLKLPVRPPSCSLIWSSIGDKDTNRFNIYFGSGYLGCDYRDPNGKLHTLLPGNKIKFLEKTWTHVAIVRKGNKYEFFKDGKLTFWEKDESPSLPTSVGWKIGEREPGHQHFEGWIDEVQFSNKALLPREFLNAFPPGEAKKEITVALIKTKLKGKVAYDKKTALLTLAYDFTAKNQLDDFDVDMDKFSLTVLALNLEPQALAKHKVKFTEVTPPADTLHCNSAIADAAA
jgi:Concanavalin A-like lectin/glucanases superfamily